MKADTVEVVSKLDGAHKRFAVLRADMNDTDTYLDRLFVRYEESQKEMRDQGVSATMLLSPKLEAAYKAWQAGAERETAVALTEIPEAPMMPLEDELGGENPRYGPGNPDWERDFDKTREDR